MMDLKTFVENKNAEMQVSTVKVCGFYETMVVLIVDGEPDYGMELACERFDNAEDAYFNHLSAVNRAKLGRFDDAIAMYH